MNGETKKFDLRNEDLKDLQELGQGNGGSVKKVEHIPTGTLMAKKASLRLRAVVARKIYLDTWITLKPST